MTEQAKRDPRVDPRRNDIIEVFTNGEDCTVLVESIGSGRIWISVSGEDILRTCSLAAWQMLAIDATVLHVDGSTS